MAWERPLHPPGRRWWAWAAAAGTAAVLAVGLGVGRQPDRSVIVTDPSARPGDDRSAIIAPAPVGFAQVADTAAGTGPVVPAAPRLTVVAVDDLGRVHVIDLRTGDRRRLDVELPPTIGATRVGVDTIVEVDGRIVMDADDAVVVVDLETSIVHMVTVGRRVVTSTTRHVWLVHDLTDVGATAVRFEPGRFADRARHPMIRLPARAHAVAGSPRGLIVAQPGQTIVVSGDGTHRQVASGPALASDGERLAWLRCEPAQACAIAIGTVDEPDRVRTPLARSQAPAIPRTVAGAFSPDGRLLAVAAAPRSADGPALGPAEVSVIDAASGRLRRRIATGQPWSSAPVAWSPDSRWLAVGTGRTITLWSAARDELVALDDIGIVTSVRGLLVSSTIDHG